MRLLFALAPVLVGVALLLAGAFRAAADGTSVHVLTIDGGVNPVLERYLSRGIGDAEEAGAALIVIRMDTPGGLDSSMRDIIKRMIESTVPIAVFVSPAGARAGSAGTFITLAAQIAAMAPGTNIGAASPISSSGEDIGGTLGEKIENDAAALIRSLAEQRGRNADWAESAVREASSYTAEEALAANGIDLVAPDLPALLMAIEGRTVRVGTTDIVLHVTGLPIQENGMSVIERFLDSIADPNIAFILLSLGALGILVEFLNPGLIVPGALGVISFILAYFSLGSLDANAAGVALVLLGFALIVADVFLPSFMVLTLAGMASLVAGGLILTTDAEGGEAVSKWTIVGTVAAIVFVVVSLGSLVMRTRKKLIQVGAELLLGKTGVARSRIAPEGWVSIQGERWGAISDSGPIEEGERVIIDRVEGLKLRVRRAAATTSSN